MGKKITFTLVSIAVLAIAILLFAGNFNTPVSGRTSDIDFKDVDVVLFYGQGCSHCAKLEVFLDGLEQNKPNLHVKRYEIYFDNNNVDLFEQFAAAYKIKIQGVPTVFIDDKTIVGFNEAIRVELEQDITNCEISGCDDPSEMVEKYSVEEGEKTDIQKKLTIPAVISAALADALNPCAFAVLIILLSTILASGDKKRALLAGSFFSLAIFISYFLMGLGVYSAIKASGFTSSVFFIVAILAILIGLFNLKDYLGYGKWSVTEVPISWKPKMKSLLNGVTSVPGAFLVGFIISLFLLPCTFGPYIVILGLLANFTTGSYAVSLLLLYNFIFILPMIIITLAVYMGITTIEKAERWRKRRRNVLHLIAGIIILILGIVMLFALFGGWI